MQRFYFCLLGQLLAHFGEPYYAKDTVRCKEFEVKKPFVKNIAAARALQNQLLKFKNKLLSSLWIFLSCGRTKFQQLIFQQLLNITLKTETKNSSDDRFLMSFFISTTLENTRLASALDIGKRSNFIAPSEG